MKTRIYATPAVKGLRAINEWLGHGGWVGEMDGRVKRDMDGWMGGWLAGTQNDE